MREVHGSMTPTLHDRLTRIEGLLEELCQVFSISTTDRSQELRAFVTSENGQRWWDVEATKARGIGFEAIIGLEVGFRALSWLEGWVGWEWLREAQEGDQGARAEASTGQYL